jgi:hypothetical protein
MSDRIDKARLDTLVIPGNLMILFGVAEPNPEEELDTELLYRSDTLLIFGDKIVFVTSVILYIFTLDLVPIRYICGFSISECKFAKLSVYFYGQTLVTLYEDDDTIILIDEEYKHIFESPSKHLTTVTQMGCYIITTTDNTISVYDINRRSLVKSFNLTIQSRIMFLFVLNDTQILCIGDNKVCRYELCIDRLMTLESYEIPTDEVRQCEFIHELNILVLMLNNSFCIIEFSTKKQFTLGGHDNDIIKICYMKESDYICSISMNQLIISKNVLSHKDISIIIDIEQQITSLNIIYGKRILITVNDSIYIFDYDGNIMETIEVNDFYIFDILVVSNTRCIAYNYNCSHMLNIDITTIEDQRYLRRKLILLLHNGATIISMPSHIRIRNDFERYYDLCVLINASFSRLYPDNEAIPNFLHPSQSLLNVLQLQAIIRIIASYL